MILVIGGMGFMGTLPHHDRWDAALFGEAPSRIVVTCAPGNIDVIELAADEAGVPVTVLGSTGGDRFTLEGLLDEPLATLADAFENGLERALEG